jgi:hypothetical protein
MMEQMKMRLDADKSFTQMCEDGNMKDGLWGQMMQLDSPEFQKSMKEIRSMNGKTAFYKIAKDNDSVGSFVWAVLAFCVSPLDDGAGLQNPAIN